MFTLTYPRIFSLNCRIKHLPSFDYRHFSQPRIFYTGSKELQSRENNNETDLSTPPNSSRFTLRKEFLEPYKARSPPFGMLLETSAKTE
jgi:hypothetical protein